MEEEPVPALLLGLVHGPVGILDQLFGGSAITGIDGDPNTGCYSYHLAFQMKRGLKNIP